jgi:hypothetical protein
MVKVEGVPEQPSKEGVTVMVAVIGFAVEFVAVNEGILPFPVAASPIDDTLLVQAYATVPPVAGLVKLMASVKAPLHLTWSATVFTVAVGFTVMVKVIDVPAQVSCGSPAPALV